MFQLHPYVPSKRMKITPRAMCAAFAIIGFLLVAQPASAAAILVVDSNGELIGATGVSVQGTLYDVSFVDGTCVALFSGCDDAVADFAFTNPTNAAAASQALIDQVFLGAYDSAPNLTFGCTDLTRCYVGTPWDTALNPGFVQMALAVNTSGSTLDYVAYTGTSISNNFSASSTFVYADWTTSAATPVPEPASMLLLGTGLLGAGVRRWRQKRA